MTNSFLKSLPSHKKKRKLRHQRRAGSQGQSQSDGGHAHSQPQVHAEELGAGNISRWEHSTLFTDVKPPCQQEDAKQQLGKSSSHEEKNNDAKSESSLLSCESSVVPATEFQHVPVTLAASAEVDDGSGTDKSLLSSPLPSQQEREAALEAAGASERQKEYDEETVGMYSPLSGRSHNMECAQKNSSHLEPESPEKDDDGKGKLSTDGGKPYKDDASKLIREKFDSFKESKTNNSTEQSKTVDRQQTPLANRDSILSRLPNGLLIGSESKPGIFTIDQRRPLNIQRSTAGNKTPDEWILTSSDINACINEIKAVSGRAQDDDDLIDVDLDSFQSNLEKFKAYIITLGQSTSSEAAELKRLPRTEWAFAIFERGMDVNHCNVCFIYEMIEHIVAAIEECNPEEGEGGRDIETTKLHRLAECMELVFRIGTDEEDIELKESFDSLVRISLTEQGTSELLFQKSSETAKQAEPETSVQHDQQTLSPFLKEVSKIFEQYSKQTCQPLQSLLNSALDVLAKTRQGAMKLQKTALDLQDQLQNAKLEVEEAHIKQSQLEAQLNMQKYDFERHAESFDRVKEHYKHLVEKKEKELLEVKRRYEQKSVPSHQQKSVQDNLKRKQCDEDYNRQLNFPKIAGHRTGKHEDGRAKKKNRGTMEPQVSKEEDVIHESPPVSSLRKNEEHFDSRRVSAEHQHRPNNIDSHVRGQTHNRHFHRHDNDADRNPLGSLAVNSFIDHSTGSACEGTNQKPTKKQIHFQVEESSGSGVAATSKLLSSRLQYSSKTAKPADATVSSAKLSSKIPYSSKPKKLQVKNPYLKNPSPTDNSGSDQYDFKYQEVVRGKEARAALPAHECEACRKFNDAVYAQTGADMPGREQMVKECSRHRARFAPELTPADFWEMDFIDER